MNQSWAQRNEEKATLTVLAVLLPGFLGSRSRPGNLLKQIRLTHLHDELCEDGRRQALPIA